MRLFTAICALFTVALFAVTEAVTADTFSVAAIEPYKVEYTATYNGMPITAIRVLTRINQSYAISTEASNLLGSIKEQETLKAIRKGGIKPLLYTYKRSIFGNKRTERSDFNHAKNTITNTYKDRVTTLKDDNNVFGPLSYQIQMQLDLLNGLREFTYPVVTRGKIKHYHYKVVGSEKLETPLGVIDTLVLQRVREDDDRDTLLWLAERFQFLPVKLMQKEDGETYEMLIKSYTSSES